MKGRRLLGLAMTAFLMTAMTGCGEAPQQAAVTEEVKLLEPVGLSGSGEAAAYRNLYDAQVYSATVVPYVEEYGFEEDVVLDRICAFPGEAVSRGEALAYSSTENLDKQIEELQKQIEDMETEFAEYELQVREDLENPQNEVKRLEDIVENLERRKPAEYLAAPDKPEEDPSQSVSGSDAGGQTPDESGDTGEGEPPGSSGNASDGVKPDDREPTPNPAYREWEQEYNYWNGRYRITDHGINTALLQLEQKTALYELDHAYALQQMAFLQEKKNDVTIHTHIEGNVVAMPGYGYGDRVQGETPIVAVGDLGQKILKCDYINRKTVAAAEDIYAVIDGLRYEVEYVPMESEEYTRLTTQGEEVYSTLYLEGDAEAVNIGDYVAVVVVNRRQEHTLSVPADAVHKDDTGSYVYVLDGEENVYTSVRTGMSDGVYTEILSGIGEGDVVRLDQGRQYSDQRLTVERGNFYSDFSASGIMIYPSSVAAQNPISHGTVYFQEFRTAMYQHVEKGDVIATVRVAADEIGMQRLTLQLQRQLERVQDLTAQGEEKNKKAIEDRMKAIAKLQEQIEELSQDYQTTVIRADRSGIVIWMQDLEKEDILQKDQYLLEIADENTCYVALKDEGNVLSYGNQVTVTYRNREEEERTAQGVVANVNSLAVSRALQSEYTYILLPSELIGDMSVGTEGWGGWWNRARFGVEARLREMEHVLVVPRRAVREINGQTYVNVVEADGSIVRRSFIAGGYDKSNYWVVEGLTEGMVLCLE